ncbi:MULTISPECIES: molybdopterin biosynthesis protein [Rhodomicrobium]|uniref:molybdopterin biosynthesis protein n=1 Tax=Rhodomicrobium TaxID=1068 RepID=UPI000B4C0CF1|nr:MULTISPECIES: molybdopterin biosynthesis protein [Rhodomicrobium]
MSDIPVLEQVRRAARQEQFLEVVSRDEAEQRFRNAVPYVALPPERVSLADASGRILAENLFAPIDLPPFDRSSVDGFALRAHDTLGASESKPARLRLNPEVLACGTAPAMPVAAKTATVISTGGVVPRGADAVVMIEHTAFGEDAGGPYVEIRRPVAAGNFIAFAGSDVGRGEAVLWQGVELTSREIGIIAACGLAHIPVVRRPRVGIISTGDELVPPGEALPHGGIYDSNHAIIAAAVKENGGVPVPFGIVRDDEAALAAIVKSAIAETDLVVLSGGTSKGAGDVSYRILSELGLPGIIVHGVALKPGKPLCLAVVHEKPVVVLPGFPTSAIFTFHSFVAPLIRAMAGLPPHGGDLLRATLPVRVPSELGRTEYVMVSLSEGEAGVAAFPLGRGSGSVTAFSRADGFFAIDALADAADAGSQHDIQLIAKDLRLPDLVLAGSQDIGLDAVVGLLLQQGLAVRTLAIGSMGGLAALKRGECDLAPVHLLDAKSGTYNAPFLGLGMSLVPGWRRQQGIVFRKGDDRFEGLTAKDAVASAAANADAILVNRNAGSGTRILLDGILGGARPAGYANQPKSHNAVAAAVAQGRADWGMAIENVARLYGLGFLPVADEHYDFFLADSRRDRPAVQAFLAALASAEARAALRRLGFTPSGAGHT